MPDLYLTIADQPQKVVDAIAQSMNTRAGDPKMREICAQYLEKLPSPGGKVLEIGCGNGAASALILEHLQPSAFIGVDPSPGLIEFARDRFSGLPAVDFMTGTATMSAQADAAFDIVVAHTVYSHLDDPEAALAEAMRVLRPGGTLAIFDGDYATNTVSLFDGDPLQSAMDAARRHLIHDPYVMRRLPGLMEKAGFEISGTDAHGYVQTTNADYLLTLLSRGVDAAIMAGEIRDEVANGLKREAARRVEEGRFYGAILFLSVIAQKPA